MSVSTVLIETASVAATAARLSSGRIVVADVFDMTQLWGSPCLNGGALKNFNAYSTNPGAPFF
jgi:hypothetical protein